MRKIIVLRWQARWEALSRRERSILLTWSLAVLVLLLWLAIVSPLGRRIDLLEQRIPELEAQLNAMRSQALNDLPVQAANGTNGKGAADLRSTLFRALGDKKISAELRALSSSRVEMRLPEMAMSEAVDLLEYLRSESASRIVVINVINVSTAIGAASRLVLEFERAP
jgi:type II secretory pathway component PulM